MIFPDERLRLQARAATVRRNLERLKREAAELGSYSTHVAVALSLICSLVGVAIISKKPFTNYLWADVAAFAVPLPVALYFRSQIVWLGAFVYVTALVLALIAALVFGI